MKIAHTILFVCFLAALSFAQQPDRWKGLIIDESKPEDAIKQFGAPGSDKSGNRYLLGKWFAKDAGKLLRILHYENIEGFGDVKLGFGTDGVLRVIHLEPKKLTAQALINSYEGLEFRFANEVMSPADFKSPRDSVDRPRRLGAFYEIVAVTDKVVVQVGVGNATGSVASELFGSSQNRVSRGRTYPGDAKVILLISRTLENRDGSDLLK